MRRAGDVARPVPGALYALIGDAFGAAGDPTRFRLPDARGRAVAAASTPRVMGTSVGSETHAITQTQLPSHTHTATTGNAGSHTHGVTDPGHAHTQTTVNDDFNLSGGNPPGFAADSAGTRTWDNISTATTGVTVNAAGTHVHTLTTDPTGGSDAIPLLQPTLFAGNLFIFTGRS